MLEETTERDAMTTWAQLNLVESSTGCHNKAWYQATRCHPKLSDSLYLFCPFV